MSAQTPGTRIQFHLSGRSAELDRRLHAVRPDLADVSLAGILFAPHYAKAHVMHCCAPSAFLRGAKTAQAPAISQILHGEAFHVLDITGNWAWGFCAHDGYVGYVDRLALKPGTEAHSHVVRAAAAPEFAEADIKSPVKQYLPMGSELSGEVSGDFLMTPDGAVHLRHLRNAAEHETDPVAVAQRHLGAPYVWGGRGAGGIDCSGLVQIALGQCGHKVPRDSDLQRDGIGVALADADTLQRGDLVFFPGHVGIMADADNLLHANAFWMSTVIEPLADVIVRLSAQYAQPVLARRRISA